MRSIDVADLLGLGWRESGTCIGVARKALERVFPGFPESGLPDDRGLAAGWLARVEGEGWRQVREPKQLGDLVLSENETADGRRRLHVHVLIGEIGRQMITAMHPHGVTVEPWVKVLRRYTHSGSRVVAVYRFSNG